MTSHRFEQTLQFGRLALDLAAQFGDNGVRSHALNNIGTAMMAAGDTSGLSKLEESLSVALAHNLQVHARSRTEAVAAAFGLGILKASG